MPNYKKTKTSYKKGKEPGPGRTPLSPEVKALRKLTTNEFLTLLNKLLKMTKSEIVKLIQDPQTPMLEVYLGSVLVYGTKRGDYPTLDKILDRAIGKVPVKLVGDSDNPITITVQADLSKYPAQQIENKNNVIETIENKDENLSYK